MPKSFLSARRKGILLVLGLAALAAPACAERVDLQAAERSVFSQFGEDGVIEKIFEIIGPTNEFAVEFGAADGVKNSNVRRLIVEDGWSGLLIEGDPRLARSMAQAYADLERVQTMQAWVFPGNIEILFEEAGVPRDLDFLVIDIDSNDYYVWRAIQGYQPKVVQIEANPAFEPPIKQVVEFHPMNYWDGSDYYGASAQSLYELGKQKGYELVHQSSGGNNLFFVRKEYFDRFGIENNSPEALYKPVHLFRKRADSPAHLAIDAGQIPKKFVERPAPAPVGATPPPSGDAKPAKPQTPR